MKRIQEKIIDKFGNRLRIRVCGLCIESGKILLVNHHSLNDKGEFWSPPGGGMDFGTSAEENLKREFQEETGLRIDIDQFLFVHEYLSQPLHAIELIFTVKRIGGMLKTGTDPEMDDSEQIIQKVRFMSEAELLNTDVNCVHQLFRNVKRLDELTDLSGYYFWNGRP